MRRDNEPEETVIVYSEEEQDDPEELNEHKINVEASKQDFKEEHIDTFENISVSSVMVNKQVEFKPKGSTKNGETRRRSRYNQDSSEDMEEESIVSNNSVLDVQISSFISNDKGSKTETKTNKQSLLDYYELNQQNKYKFE